MRKLARLRFIKPYGAYNTGEVAGFEPHVAAKLVLSVPPFAAPATEEDASILGIGSKWQDSSQPAHPPVSDAEQEQTAGEDAEDLEQLTIVLLRERLVARGLPVYGTKAQLIERLRGA
jgi:hypothetical protein